MSLPKMGTRAFDLLEVRYETCHVSEMAVLAEKYDYKTADSFQRQMRKLGVKRQVTSGGWEPSGINIPLELKLAKEPKKIAILGDFQCPYHDEKALALAEEVLYVIEPDIMIYNGDGADFYQASRFNKNPARIDDLQTDIDITKSILRRHKVRYPNTKRKWLDGNHEYRLQAFLWNSAIALASLKCLTIPELFNLSEYDVDYIPYEQGLMVNGIFLVIHGDITSVHSSYTAKRMYEKHGGCGICNHSHRGGVYYKRDRFGTWGWWENFCMCHLNPDWIKNPNWVQGLSIIHFLGKRFWVEQIPIIDHSLMYGGKVYK